MTDCRFLFSKEGRGRYISHLDLMRTMQRAFLRAGIPIRHTEGFNPHPRMVFALPLSLGCDSVCELMDVTLAEEAPDLDALPDRLNHALPEGLSVKQAYRPETKFKELRWVEISGKLIYDKEGLSPMDGPLHVFFAKDSIVVDKKSKKGVTAFDIAPWIHAISFEQGDAHQVSLRAVLSAQDPTLNPELLLQALRQWAPDFVPDFALFRRTELLDSAFRIFR